MRSSRFLSAAIGGAAMAAFAEPEPKRVLHSIRSSGRAQFGGSEAVSQD